jgi:hypothetical protein
MKITGKTIIFKNDIGYSTSISNKKEDGTYENMSISVNFRKGVELENKTKINITDGFLSFYKTKNDEKRLKLVVMDFEQADKIDGNDVFELTSEDLPF